MCVAPFKPPVCLSVRQFVCPSATVLVCLLFSYHSFEHVTLTVTFDLHFANFNSPKNSLTIRHMTSIFGVRVPFIKRFLNALFITLREPKVLYI